MARTSASDGVDQGLGGNTVRQELSPMRAFPSGFHFQPTDEELISTYLRKKINNLALPLDMFHDVNLYLHQPEELIERYKVFGDQGIWYFFSPRDRKYVKGTRPNRVVGEEDGYWKATGLPQKILVNGETIGTLRALVYYKGEPGKGTASIWIMHEYVYIGSSRQPSGLAHDKLNDWVLCTIRKKRGTEKKKDNKVRARRIPPENKRKKSLEIRRPESSSEAPQVQPICEQLTANNYDTQSHQHIINSNTYQEQGNISWTNNVKRHRNTMSPLGSKRNDIWEIPSPEDMSQAPPLPLLAKQFVEDNYGVPSPDTIGILGNNYSYGNILGFHPADINLSEVPTPLSIGALQVVQGPQQSVNYDFNSHLPYHGYDNNSWTQLPVLATPLMEGKRLDSGYLMEQNVCDLQFKPEALEWNPYSSYELDTLPYHSNHTAFPTRDGLLQDICPTFTNRSQDDSFNNLAQDQSLFGQVGTGKIAPPKLNIKNKK